MDYIHSKSNLHLIHLNVHELKVVRNILCEVCHSIPERGFCSRMGYPLDKVTRFAENLNQKINDDTPCQNSVPMEISRDEFYIMWHAFNEICYGLKIANYEQVTGIDKLSLVKMFDEWVSFEDKIS